MELIEHERDGQLVLYCRDVAPEDVYPVQSRAEMRYDTIDAYAQMMRDGVEFDACEGVLDITAARLYIWDGCHRVEAAKKTGGRLMVRVTYGEQADAEWLAFSANAKHGMPRTQQDIARVVRGALRHAQGAQQGDRELGRHCGVHHSTVAKYRKELELSGEISQITSRIVTRKGTSYQQGVKKGPYAAVQAPPRCLFCGATGEHIYRTAAQQKLGICLGCARLAVQQLNPNQEDNYATRSV